MRDELLKSLLKSKADDKETLEKLLDKFLKTNRAMVEKQTKKFLSELFLFIYKQYPKMNKNDILSICESKLKAFSVSADTTNLERIYELSVLSAVPAYAISFNKVDTKSINALYRHFFWLGDDATKKTQDEVREIIKGAFEGKYSQTELGDILREKFEKVSGKSSDYFQRVADHNMKHARSAAKVRAWENIGVKYAKVVATLDNNTSEFCRSINGKIIEVSHLSRQQDEIDKAESKHAMKKAAPWQSKAMFKEKLPEDIGRPPYHFDCRTTIVAYFKDENIVDGVKATGSYAPGSTYKGEKVAFSHIDVFGREIIVTQERYQHIKDGHGLGKKDIIKALNSVSKVGNNVAEEAYPGSFGAISANGTYISFHQNTIKTMFPPDSGKKYFKDNTINIQTRGLKKWINMQ